jgi:hypothetical protein
VLNLSHEDAGIVRAVIEVGSPERGSGWLSPNISRFEG